MKYVFFGTPDFSARVLTILLEQGLIPQAVVCNPDRPAGRKKIITPPPVKVAAETWSSRSGETIDVIQPEKLDADFENRLRKYNPDIFIVFAYNKILRKNILAIPRLGAIGVHPSRLPEYRGPSPFQTAILDGKTETGVTLYRLDEGVDSGPLFAASGPVPITEDDTFSSLAMKLADAGGELLIKTLPDILAEKITPEPQDETRATYTKKFMTSDGYIAPEEFADAARARAIMRKIHAFNPEPGAWTMQNDKRIKLLRAALDNERLVLLETQREGEKPKAGDSSLL